MQQFVSIILIDNKIEKTKNKSETKMKQIQQQRNRREI